MAVAEAFSSSPEVHCPGPARGDTWGVPCGAVHLRCHRHHCGPVGSAVIQRCRSDVSSEQPDRPVVVQHSNPCVCGRHGWHQKGVS